MITAKVYLLAMCAAGLVGMFAALRRPAYERPCPESTSERGEHEFIIARDTGGVFESCMACGCRTPGWPVFQRKRA